MLAIWAKQGSKQIFYEISFGFITFTQSKKQMIKNDLLNITKALGHYSFKYEGFVLMSDLILGQLTNLVNLCARNYRTKNLFNTSHAL